MPPTPHEAELHRHAGGRRRRRRGRKRRAVVQGLVMGALVFGAQARPKASPRAQQALPVAEVHVSMDSFLAIPPYLAYDDIIDEAARKFDVDSELIHAVIATESAFNPFAVSRVGAQGLMQLMPALQAELGVDDPFDPRQNIMAGTQYLKQLIASHHGNIELALASYNAGPGNVARYRGVPPFTETRRYVKKIKALLADADNG